MSSTKTPYTPKAIEGKWAKVWDETKAFKAEGIDSSRPKVHVLDMFPYPSGEGLHIGHAKVFTASDVYARFKRMQGYNVLHATGWDAFGLPAEQYALKHKVHPKDTTKKNTDTFRRQMKLLGLSYDWDREINTTDPNFYKWTQWIFLQLWNHGLVKEVYEPINWCPSCKTGLANEDLEGNVCERCGTIVEKKPLRQFSIEITKYAEKLLDGLNDLDWKENVKDLERNWIGKSEGAEIEFLIRGLTPTLSKGEGAAQHYMTADIKTYEALQVEAKRMRQNPTAAEELLWENLRDKKLGWNFRRQHIVNNFIADFVCLEKKVIIEVDGEIHDFQIEKDNERTRMLNDLGFSVLRFSNSEVLNNVENVSQQIRARLKEALSFGEGWVRPFTIFTTRPDTLFGCTYCVMAPEHALVSEMLEAGQIENKAEVEKYIEEVKLKTEIERSAEGREKTGVELKGVKAVNPANNEEVPIFIADYVLATYGTGAIMAVPAHDERDFEFAKKYNLAIEQVIAPIKVGEGDYKPRSNDNIFRSSAASAILKHWEKELFYIVNFSDTDDGLVGGKVEDGETKIDAVKREVIEETGYKNFKNIEEILISVMVRVFKPRKDREEFVDDSLFFVELKNSEKTEIIDSETVKGQWATAEEIAKNTKFSNYHKFLFEYFLNKKIFSENGILINSGKFDGMESEEAKKAITEFVGGKMVTKYKLRDWVFARQRYWGEPFPLVHVLEKNDKGEEVKKIYPVDESELPVVLPDVKDYEPTGTGESPLANMEEWVNVEGYITDKGTFKLLSDGESAPAGKEIVKAKRETNTMPQWAGSSWYWLRYMDPTNSERFVGRDAEKYWGQVDIYLGGMEHATRHLIYGRFWHRFLYDIGELTTPEPFKRLEAVGLVLGEGGVKMSKRLGNVINPDDVAGQWGVDTLRTYILFMGPYHDSVAWNSKNLIGPRRFLERVWSMQYELVDGQLSKEADILLNQTIKKLTEDNEALRFNTGVSALMILFNALEKEAISKENYLTFLKLLAPYAPFMAEEIWQILGQSESIHHSSWPTFDLSKLESANVTIAVQYNGKVRETIQAPNNATQEEVERLVKSSVSYTKWVGDKEVKKVIFVPNKIINLIV